MDIKRRFFKLPKESFFLFGPRGTGKSVFLRKHCPDAVYVDLLSPEMFRMLSARPERLLEVIEASESGKAVIIDEVQKLPNLLDVVHQLIGDGKRQFILTGSSSRKLKRSGVNLLAGRAILKTLHPFLAKELENDFDLIKALDIGMLPLVWNSQNPRETLNAYVTLYIKEEIQMEGLVRNIGDFTRFLETISFSQGSILNLSHIARECQTGRKAVESYITILENLLLAFRLPVFSKRAKRHLIAHEKFYFFDIGVFLAVRPRGPLDVAPERRGIALEGLTAQHLRGFLAYRGQEQGLFYWRTKSGVEVDFVVYGTQTFVAIEVKSSSTVHPGDVRGLRAFHEDYPEAKSILLYLGKEKLRINGVLCLPCAEFLQSLDPQKTLEELFFSSEEKVG